MLASLYTTHEHAFVQCICTLLQPSPLLNWPWAYPFPFASRLMLTVYMLFIFFKLHLARRINYLQVWCLMWIFLFPLYAAPFSSSCGWIWNNLYILLQHCSAVSATNSSDIYHPYRQLMWYLSRQVFTKPLGKYPTYRHRYQLQCWPLCIWLFGHECIRCTITCIAVCIFEASISWRCKLNKCELPRSVWILIEIPLCVGL